ncbi:MAG: hypothetical protein RMK89_10135, partial [Armatimonadota bacterium]|nr:hypothetical protein [Armatimonadota bacterium]MDW8143807.1 hypothetical protein [Armatimonadota bacterium]
VPYLPTVKEASAHPSGILARGGLDFAYRSVLRLSMLAFLLLFVQLVRMRAELERLSWKRLQLPLKETEA